MEPKPKSAKNVAENIWTAIGGVEITSADDLRTGAPVIPVLGKLVREVMVETIRACAAHMVPEGSDEQRGDPADYLDGLAERVAKTRPHQLRMDLKENANDDQDA